MAQKHPLIRHAHFFPPVEPVMTAGWVYRRDIGAWVESVQPDSLMVAPQPKPNPTPRPAPPTSKKADRETGEDLKGP